MAATSKDWRRSLVPHAFRVPAQQQTAALWKELPNLELPPGSDTKTDIQEPLLIYMHYCEASLVEQIRRHLDNRRSHEKQARTLARQKKVLDDQDDRAFCYATNQQDYVLGDVDFDDEAWWVHELEGQDRYDSVLNYWHHTLNSYDNVCKDMMYSQGEAAASKEQAKETAMRLKRLRMAIALFRARFVQGATCQLAADVTAAPAQ